MEFESREDALLYAFERQAVRRNLSSAEILAAAEALEKKARDGRGRAAERLAERLGVSAALVYQARKITKEAPPEVVDAVKKGERSIKSAYGQITGKKPEKKPGVTEGKPSESAGIPPVLPKSGFDRIRLIEEIEEAVTMIDMNAADTAKIRGLLERVRGCLVTDTGQ
jgi:hypothetical protein